MELIFVHGALVRDGRWWWQPTADLLQERTGIHSRALALPSCGEVPGEPVAGGLTADAAALRRELDAVTAPDGAIVVGHSYGGTVIAEAGRHDAIAPNDDGTLSVAGYDVTSFAARFLQDADRSTQQQAWARVTSQAVEAFTTPTTTAGWQGADSTYLVCTQDRSTSLPLQRHHAARATRTADLPTGHHPFLTHPDLVTDQLEALAAQH